MHERGIRSALAAVIGSLISIGACGGSGDDDTDSHPNGSEQDASAGHDAGPSHDAGAHQDAGTHHDAGGTHAADASGPTEQPDDAGADAGLPDEREVAAAHFCHADCLRQMQCSSADAGCEAACPTKTERWSADFLGELSDCIERLACDEDDSSCYGDALIALDPNFADDPSVSDCGQLSHDCAFDENLCPSLLLLSADAQQKAKHCLSLECKDDIGACLTNEGAFSP